MERTRVVITGVGAVSAAGPDASALQQALMTGSCCLSPLTGQRAELLSFRMAGQAHPAVDPRLDPVSVMAVSAGEEAMRTAGLANLSSVMASVIIGTGGGGLEAIDAGYQAILTDQRRRPSPFTVPKTMPSAPTSALAHRFAANGVSFGVASACASGSQAIGLGLWLLRQGACDVALVGGTDAPLTLGNLRAWDALRAVSPDTCRPFSLDRNGLVLGEGAAVFVLERAAHAQARGARALAEVAGFGSSGGEGEITTPSATGFALAMTRALQDAQMSAEAIDYVQAHGTGTRSNDSTEATALHEVFGARISQVAVSSSKGCIGHTIGASGALGLAATVLAMTGGWVPPNVGFTTPDPDCVLDLVGPEARDAKIQAALCNSFAFGNLNASLVVRGL